MSSLKRCSRQFALAGALACLLMPLLSGTTLAQGKSKSTQSEADWISYDAEAQTITVKLRKAGRGPDTELLEKMKNKKVTFQVKAEGSILSRTTVAINGLKGALADLPEGKRVNIYWRPTDDGGFFARKIDAIMSQEEFDAKYGTD